ncbi:MAG: hypothetical protein JRN67_07205, partial [Nitrososphaerota archaeon]|nr:hypothetical protein [Nitrososphaerota archaeon]
MTTETGRPILFDPNLVVFHKVYPERTTIGFVSKYSFWQGFAEARYRSNDAWKMARQEKWANSASLLVTDVLSSRGGLKFSVLRDFLLLIRSLYLISLFVTYKS